ncbi:beta-hexosaminidase [Tabrizicola sp. J26]|uniref:glycoside hydrolase family 3 N-terminal domain-containing protein n=1 Tax=Alitabrizicola rongguiensis TaxID=2909234 RepID=UPI001F1FAFA8|nr:glycoside hydrolase family 3 N-terminal domain-containing protein [Tabrizicola rongguiensis]MCF1710060.1 beta-hexosaminidase [Tabrizicola rongguiensis]
MSPTGATILGCLEPTVSADERAFFREANPWGFILFARNVEAPEQLRRLTGDLRDAVGRDAPIFVDQEGGRVQRLRAPHWREWAPPLDTVTAAGPNAPRVMNLRFQLIAAELRAVGIDGDCAPTADLATDVTHPFLKNRCYGNDVNGVIEVAREVAKGLLAGGVLPVMKHMPGHGRASLDTHHELPRVTAEVTELAATDFAVFRALSDLPLGMTAHIVFSALDDRPSTASEKMVKIIRQDIGFDGLLMTDDLSMQALSGTLGERAAAARAAGCDIMLHCNGKRPEMEEVVAAAGRLTDRAQRRASAALALRKAPDHVDIAALEAELSALMEGRGTA